MVLGFDEILEAVKNKRNRKVAVAVAQDEPALEAVRDAIRENIADAILVGDLNLIRDAANEMDFDISNIEIIDEKDDSMAALKAVELVRSGKADILMKGIVDTATFLRAVLNKEKGLRTGKLLSHVTVFHAPALNRMMLLTDGAMNIAPDLAAKKAIIENAVQVAHILGMELPKVAPVCAVEVVNPDMLSTVDAAALSKMNDRGQIKGCIVDGPLALDNAISEEAAIHKGIKSPVAGKADIILVPNIETGNVMYKTLAYTSNAKNGSILIGASAPVVLTSRSDSSESKLYSIALASFVSSHLN